MEGTDTRVTDEDVDAAKGVDSSLDDRSGRVGGRNVASDRHALATSSGDLALDLGDVRLCLLAQVVQDDMGTVLGSG